jgi:hypothetical protein
MGDRLGHVNLRGREGVGLSPHARKSQRVVLLGPRLRRGGIRLLRGLRGADYNEVERDPDYLNFLFGRSLRSVVAKKSLRRAMSVAT